MNFDAIINKALPEVNMGPLEDLDSLGKMEFLMALEDAFGINIAISDIPPEGLTRESTVALLREALGTFGATEMQVIHQCPSGAN